MVKSYKKVYSLFNFIRRNPGEYLENPLDSPTIQTGHGRNTTEKHLKISACII